MLNNVFLEFLSRDSQEFHGIDAHAIRSKKHRILSEALNIGVFLCSDFCVVPPSFFVESQLTRELLLRSSDYLGERLIRMPLKERSLDEFWAKKEKEYAPIKDHYPDVFDKKKQNYLNRYAEALMSRPFNVANRIVQAWEEGPDVDEAWRSIRDEIQTKDLELIRRVPRVIREKGLAIAWPAIEDAIKGLAIDPRVLHYVLQHHYLSIYVRCLNLRIITRLPSERISFLLGDTDLCYDYEALKSALAPIDLWNIVRFGSPELLIRLRMKAGYLNFREAFNAIALDANEPRVILRAFAAAAKDLKEAPEISRLAGIDPQHGKSIRLSDEVVDMVALKLESAASVAQGYIASKESQIEDAAVAPLRGTWKMESKVKKEGLVAVFVALDQEREFLTKRWKLSGTYKDGRFYGELGGVQLVVFSSNRMGRVAGAVATMDLLNGGVQPDLLIVTGIAGGFEQEGVQLGDVIVAESIADLASRKIHDEPERIEFRPREFSLDDRILRFLRSGSFSKRGWEQSVIDDAEWPEGRRPTIRYGTLASIDEVVSSNEWIKGLCEAWPKLQGVEMEAGGVCAAAERFGLKPTVIRGVSDHANPLKSDDKWRIIAMKTVAHLLEHIDLKMLISK
jgi:nucleoside phosphorylase